MPVFRSQGREIADTRPHDELLRLGSVEGPPTDEERWESGADPENFIRTRGMARWLYVSRASMQGLMDA